MSIICFTENLHVEKLNIRIFNFFDSILGKKRSCLVQKWELKLILSGNQSQPKSFKKIPPDCAALLEQEYLWQSTSWRAFKPRAFSSFGFKRLLSSDAPTYSIGMQRNVHDLHSNGCSCFLRECKILHSAYELQPSHSSSSLYFSATSEPFSAVAVKWQNRYSYENPLWKRKKKEKENGWNILASEREGKHTCRAWKKIKKPKGPPLCWCSFLLLLFLNVFVVVFGYSDKWIHHLNCRWSWQKKSSMCLWANWKTQRSGKKKYGSKPSSICCSIKMSFLIFSRHLKSRLFNINF